MGKWLQMVSCLPFILKKEQTSILNIPSWTVWLPRDLTLCSMNGVVSYLWTVEQQLTTSFSLHLLHKNIYKLMMKFQSVCLCPMVIMFSLNQAALLFVQLLAMCHVFAGTVEICVCGACFSLDLIVDFILYWLIVFFNVRESSWPKDYTGVQGRLRRVHLQHIQGKSNAYQLDQRQISFSSFNLKQSDFFKFHVWQTDNRPKLTLKAEYF